MEIIAGNFSWDSLKETDNIAKHNVDFRTAAKVFRDPEARIFYDKKHSRSEERLFAIGKVEEKIITVRFMYREGVIRIFGAGYWRKGKKYYETKKGKG